MEEVNVAAFRQRLGQRDFAVPDALPNEKLAPLSVWLVQIPSARKRRFRPHGRRFQQCRGRQRLKRRARRNRHAADTIEKRRRSIRHQRRKPLAIASRKQVGIERRGRSGRKNRTAPHVHRHNSASARFADARRESPPPSNRAPGPK